MKASRSRLAPVAAAAALLLLSSWNKAQAADASTTSSADKAFVQQLALDGKFEFEASKLAADRGASQKVKHLAIKLMQEQSAVNDSLKSTAAAKNIDLPTQQNATNQAMLDDLTKLWGLSFDLAYLQDMEKVHLADHTLLQQEAAATQVNDLKTFANKTDETGQQHTAQVQDLKAKVTQ